MGRRKFITKKEMKQLERLFFPKKRGRPRKYVPQPEQEYKPLTWSDASFLTKVGIIALFVFSAIMLLVTIDVAVNGLPEEQHDDGIVVVKSDGTVVY